MDWSRKPNRDNVGTWPLLWCGLRVCLARGAVDMTRQSDRGQTFLEHFSKVKPEAFKNGVRERSHSQPAGGHLTDYLDSLHFSCRLWLALANQVSGVVFFRKGSRALVIPSLP
jgi:hypothetical protein